MPWPTKRRLIGTSVPRLDGPDKATGRAKYSYDINRPGLLHARILRCPHARARLQTLNTAAAEQLPGFRGMHRIAADNTELYFAGAEVLAIAADTEEHAEDCIRAVRAQYEVLAHYVKEEDALRDAANARTVPGAQPENVRPGGEFTTANFDQEAYRNNPTRIEATYHIPVISHQCLETHGLVAEWDNDLRNLTVWASTQAVPGTADALRTHFRARFPQEAPNINVKCITNHMGGGYGSKFGPDIQGTVCAELARICRAPVKLMLDRTEEVFVGGSRPSASGTVRIAGDAMGNIRAFEVDCYGSPGVGAGATVNLGLLPYVYTAVPFVKRKHRVLRLNFGAARAMRAPGHPQNCILTDSAIDDLAAVLNLDPLQVRLRNLPPNDPAAVQNDPQSFLALRHTIYTREIEAARTLSDWNNKWHRPGAGQGTVKRGIGMAMHTWGGAGRQNNDHTVTIRRDGSVTVQCSTQDLGTAQRTVEAIVVAEALGLQVPDITVQIGDSTYGRSTGSGGSTTCPGTAPPAYAAALAARTALIEAIAPRLGVPVADLVAEHGFIVNNTNPRQRWTWREACARLGQNPVIGRGDWTPGMSNNGVGGLQVAEVTVDTETGVVKCTRVVAVQDCGMIINQLGCESQVAGGVIMGVNYALFEECIFDRRTGRQVNPDMEFYKLGGIQDMPNITVHMIDMPERGVIGIGEPPTISTAAAVGNAIFNAIGVRVTRMPFSPENVLAALENRNRGNNP